LSTSLDLMEVYSVIATSDISSVHLYRVCNQARKPHRPITARIALSERFNTRSSFAAALTNKPCTLHRENYRLYYRILTYKSSYCSFKQVNIKTTRTKLLLLLTTRLSSTILLPLTLNSISKFMPGASSIRPPQPIGSPHATSPLSLAHPTLHSSSLASPVILVPHAKKETWASRAKPNLN
jgi:hypothetical protein